MSRDFMEWEDGKAANELKKAIEQPIEHAYTSKCTCLKCITHWVECAQKTKMLKLHDYDEACMCPACHIHRLIDTMQEMALLKIKEQEEAEAHKKSDNA